MKRKLVHYAACMLLVLNVGVLSIEARAETSGFAGGSGTADDPYLIETAAQLDSVRNDLEAHYKLTADIVFADEDFEEGGACYNDGSGWTPIGNSSTPFAGVLDGNGHSITGLCVNLSASSKVAGGLFGYAKGAVIRDLGMEDGEINISSGASLVYAGGIVGYAYNSSSITNCYNTGKIISNADNAYIGGIAGDTHSSSITGCYNTGLISGGDDGGGIVGNAAFGSIIDCYNRGEVRINGDFAGGIAGNAPGTSIKNCYNAGKITANGGYNSHVGGITGCLYNGGLSSNPPGTITNCYNTGEIISGDLAGGIAGSASEASSIANCYNTGKVSSTDTYSNAGGIAGSATTSITNCYNTGEIGAKAYGSDAGGIVGAAYEVTTIENCYYLDTIGLGVGSGTDTATKCTDELLRSQETFFGFGFTSTWTMGGEERYPYPELVEVPLYAGYVCKTLGHSWVDTTGTILRTCETCGVTEPETSVFAGGSGTEEDPYLISTAAHLNNVRRDLDAHYKLVADIVFTYEDFEAGSTYYNEGTGWIPIGDDSTPFTGVFDGNGHSVTGLYINISVSAIVYGGLFGYVNNAAIRDLGMEDGSISTASTSYYNDYAGAIAGYAYESSIMNCYNTGEVSSSNGNQSYAGGIVGLASGCDITNCYNTGKISSSKSMGGYTCAAGGIVGNARTDTIKYCYNTGYISCSTGSVGTSCPALAGGIAGYATGGSIEKSYNTGTVYGSSPDSRGRAGGIVGDSSDIGIANCYNAGSIQSGSTYMRCDGGGIAGYASGNSIANCYNVGSISCYSREGSSYAGGIAGGVSNSTVTNCYYLDKVSAGIGSGTDSTTKCSDEQLKVQDTFKNFNFAAVWTMEGNGSYLYPELIKFEDLRHSWVDADCDTPKTCSICGATEGEALGHDWDEATCSAPKTCSACGETEGEHLGHSYTDKASGELASAATCTAAATYYVQCDRCEAVSESETVAVGEALGHSWGDATCTAPKTCSVCGETEGERLGHSYTDKASGELASAATCTAAATYYVQCDRCEAVSESETVAVGEALGHSWGDATCTAPKTCSACGETEGEHLGHDWSGWQRIAEPTYVTAGTDSRACGRCGETEERDVAPTGQSVVDAVQREEKDGVLTLVGLPADIGVLTAAYLDGRMTLAWSETMSDGTQVVSVPMGIEWDSLKIFFLTEDYLPVARAETYMPTT